MPLDPPEKNAVSLHASAATPANRPVPLANVEKRLVRPLPRAAETMSAARWQRHKKILRRHYSRKFLRTTRASVRHASTRFWLLIISTLASLLVIFLSLTGTATFAAVRFYSDTYTKYAPRIVTLRDLLPRDNLKIYDRKGVLIAQLTDQGLHTTVALDDVSPDLINATVATEDKNFWTNPGVDMLRILQAALDDVRSGRVIAGGSTITQQLIKKLVVGDETSIERKLSELVLTPEVNRYYSKRAILGMYLNTIYYGEQAYGIDAAATVYFGLTDKPGKPAAKQLDLAQSVMLAGLPNYPYGNDPLLHPKAAFNRFQVVINAMLSQGYITRAQAFAAIEEAQSPRFYKRPPNLVNRAPHFVNFVLSQLQQQLRLKRSQLSRSDLSVYTTLDIALQDKIQKIAQQRIAELSASNNVSNAAEVLINYRTGEILSLLGSIDYNNKSIDGQFDVATQGYRQPGSSFKPYVYVTAFEQGASPAQAIDDAPLSIPLPGENPPTFSPTNYDLKYHGHMTLRCALQNSLNVPAVKVLQRVGIKAAMQTAYNMGISTYTGSPGYSLVLGGLGVRLIDHTSAIGTFANGGVRVPYRALTKIVYNSTRQTISYPANPGKQVISPQLAYMMTNVLSDNESRLPEFSDCNPLQLYSNTAADCWNGNRGTVRPAAAKTGTTSDFRDNWTVGYTTDYVMGVWAGNDNNSPMINVTGIQGAAPIWHDAMLVAEQGRPIRDFTNPGGLERATVTYSDGVQTTDWFMPGTVPTFVQQALPLAPAATPSGSDTNSKQNKDRVAPAPQAKPYCPNNFTFTFPPSSAGKEQSLLPGWW